MSSTSSSNIAKLLSLMTEEDIAAFLASRAATQKPTPSQTTTAQTQAQPEPLPLASSSKQGEEKIEQPPPSSPTKPEPAKVPAFSHVASSPDMGAASSDPTSPKSTSHSSPPLERQPSPSPKDQITPITHIQISSGEKEEEFEPLAHLVEEPLPQLPFLQPPADQESIAKKRKASSSPQARPKRTRGQVAQPQTTIPRLDMVLHEPASQPEEVVVSSSREGGLPDARPSYAKRNVIPPVIVVPEILQGMADELDLHEAIAHLDRLGWLHLETEPFQVDLEEVTRFYSALTPQPPAKSQDDPTKLEQQCVGTLLHEEDVFVVSPKLIAKLLHLSTGSGYRVLQKKNWPSGGKSGVLKEIYGHSQVQELTNEGLLWPLKVVHYVLAKNIIPRQESATRLTIQDAALLREVAQRHEVDTARLIMIHMIASQKHTSHSFPYPHLVKKILVHFGIYRPKRETKFSQVVSAVSLRRLHRFHDPELPTPPPSPKSKPASGKGKGKVKHEEGVPDMSSSRGLESALAAQTAVNKKILVMLDVLNANLIATHKMFKHQLRNLRVLVAGPTPDSSLQSCLPRGSSYLEPSSDSASEDEDDRSEYAKGAE